MSNIVASPNLLLKTVDPHPYPLPPMECLRRRAAQPIEGVEAGPGLKGDRRITGQASAREGGGSGGRVKRTERTRLRVEVVVLLLNLNWVRRSKDHRPKDRWSKDHRSKGWQWSGDAHLA